MKVLILNNLCDYQILSSAETFNQLKEYSIEIMVFNLSSAETINQLKEY